MITVTIISKQENDRKTINALLAEQDDFRIMSAGKDGYDALNAARTQQPDIIIMDFNMEDIESPELAPVIKRNSPATALIVLGAHDKNAAAKALGAGIAGYVVTPEDWGCLASAVRSVFYGGLYISALVKSQTLQSLAGAPAAELPLTKPALFQHPFSLTEQGIFFGITCGYTDQEIAQNLNMSIGSLRNCVNQVKKKTGLQNRTQISVYALLSGILNTGKIRDTFYIEKPRHLGNWRV